MNLAIISDIHGNLPALEKALSSIKNYKVDNYFFLGDVVNYGPWGDECVELIDSIKNSFKIKGNHEEYFIKKKFNGKNVLAQKFFNTTISSFKRFDLIKEYKDEIVIDDIKFIHTLNGKYIFKDTEVDLNCDVVLGHSHQQFFRKNKNFWVLNPGSLGQNRKKINRMQYAILDTKTKEHKFFTEEYNFKKVIEEMIEKNYSEDCINYYKSKIK